MARKLTDQKIREIHRLRRSGLSREQIAAAVKISTGSVSAAFRRPATELAEPSTPALEEPVNELEGEPVEFSLGLPTLLEWAIREFPPGPRVDSEIHTLEAALAFRRARLCAPTQISEDVASTLSPQDKE